MHLNDPALAAYTVLTVDQEGHTDTVQMLGVAASARQAFRVSTADGSRVKPGNNYADSYYQDPEEERLQEKRLRYLYTEGETPSLTLQGGSPWSVRALRVEPASAPACPVSADIWWEEDGLHGQIVNRSDYTLDRGWVLTMSGYCSVPRLLPGQEHAFAIVKNPSRDSKDTAIYDGELFTGYIDGIYRVMNAAVYFEDALRGEDSYDHEWMDREEQARRQRQYSLLSACMNRWNGYALFHYVTFSDLLGRPELLLDGQPIRRTAYGTVVDVNMAYRVVGKGGIIRLARGMVPAYQGKLVNGAPAFTGVRQEDYAYYPLRDEPVVCFAPGEVRGLDLAHVELTGAELYFECYGASARVLFYNASAGRWEELQPTGNLLTLTGAQAARFLDSQGRMYVRFAQAGGTGGEVDNPVLTIEGRAR